MYSSMPYHYSPSSRRRNKKPSNKKFMRVFCCHGIDSFVVHILRRPFLLVQKKISNFIAVEKLAHTVVCMYLWFIVSEYHSFEIKMKSLRIFYIEQMYIIFVPNFFFLLAHVSIWPHGYCSFSVVNHLPAFLAYM